MAKDKRHLLVSHVGRRGRVADFLQDMGVIGAVTRERVFHDTDRALEWAENDLLARKLGEAGAREDYELDRLDVFTGLDVDERDFVRGLLVRRSYGKGDAILLEGDRGRDLFIIARGSASVRIMLPGEARENRLATFSAGTVFGEMALLDRQPRSATVVADEDLACYVLTEDAFDTLTREHGAIAIKVLTNLGRELSRRLRTASRTIYELES
jgi:CRP-like cAMP-binding protein